MQAAPVTAVEVGIVTQPTARSRSDPRPSGMASSTRHEDSP